MLSSFDDFPLHQTSHPVSLTASTDLNHFERYSFNGYTRNGYTRNGYTQDARRCFAATMGLYPNRHVADASFSVVVDGGAGGAHQINVHASRRAPADRADANDVGPIRVEVLEALHAVQLAINAPEHGLRAELTFVRRSIPLEEPHFRQQMGLRVVSDYSRFTQFGGWEGWLEIDGELVDLDPGSTWGSRNRSWGVRPVGEQASTGAPIADPQCFSLSAPLNFETFSTHFEVEELFDGRRWHETGFVTPVDTGHGSAPETMRSIDYRMAWAPGTRRAGWFEIDLVPWTGDPSTVRLEPLFHFHMLGLGYGHPEWGHGVWKGELAVAGDRWDLPVTDPNAPEQLHIQTLVRATTSGGLGEHEGIGILEQLAIGRHVPTGLDGLFDGWNPQT